MATQNPYTDPAERDAWELGYACYRPLSRDGGGAFTALWLKLDPAVRLAAYDGWTCAVIDADHDQQVDEPGWPATAEQADRLADEFAKSATRDILKPDQGLSVTEALSPKAPA
jgi:hypothetical protein